MKTFLGGWEMGVCVTHGQGGGCGMEKQAMLVF